MNWFPWKKKQQGKIEDGPRKLEIPADKVREIRALSDAYQAKKSGEDRLAHYDLWTAIAEIFPETADGRWRLDLSKATKAVVVERIDSI